MKALITKLNEFTSKKGEQWVSFSYLLEDGTTGNSFIRATQTKVRQPNVVAIDFVKNKAVNLDFDSTGRAVGLSVL